MTHAASQAIGAGSLDSLASPAPGMFGVEVAAPSSDLWAPWPLDEISIHLDELFDGVADPEAKCLT